MQKITLERLPTHVTRESEPQESWNRNRDAIVQFFTQLLCNWRVTSQIEATRTTLAPVASLKQNRSRPSAESIATQFHHSEFHDTEVWFGIIQVYHTYEEELMHFTSCVGYSEETAQELVQKMSHLIDIAEKFFHLRGLKKNPIHAGIPIYRCCLQDAQDAVKGSFTLHRKHEYRHGPGVVANFGSRYEPNKAGIQRTQ